MGYITALRKEHEAQKMRKAGEPAEVNITLRLPVINMSCGLLNTIEGGVLYNHSRDVYNAVKTAFKSCSYEFRHLMMFSPKPGEWVERAKQWRLLMECAELSDKEISYAMGKILRWHRRCVVGHNTGVWNDWA